MTEVVSERLESCGHFGPGFDDSDGSPRRCRRPWLEVNPALRTCAQSATGSPLIAAVTRFSGQRILVVCLGCLVSAQGRPYTEQWEQHGLGHSRGVEECSSDSMQPRLDGPTGVSRTAAVSCMWVLPIAQSRTTSLWSFGICSSVSRMALMADQR